MNTASVGVRNRFERGRGTDTAAVRSRRPRFTREDTRDLRAHLIVEHRFDRGCRRATVAFLAGEGSRLTAETEMLDNLSEIFVEPLVTTDEIDADGLPVERVLVEVGRQPPAENELART